MFYNLDDSPTAAFERFSAIYFTMLLYELLPFCYMSFYVWDRKFFLSDRASGLYATSAYYAAHMAASKPFSKSYALHRGCATLGRAQQTLLPQMSTHQSVVLMAT